MHTSGSKKAATVPSRAKNTVKASACSYSLHQPKQHIRELYVKVMKQAVLEIPSVRIELIGTFNIGLRVCAKFHDHTYAVLYAHIIACCYGVAKFIV